MFALLAVTALNAQENAVAKYFSDYSSNEDFTKISISGAMFQLATHIEVEDPEEQELKDAISKIKGMVILVCDSCKGNERAMYDESNRRLPKAFEELMLVEDKDADIRFTIKETNGIIDEMVMLVGGENTYVLVDIWGEIDLKNVRKLTEAFDINGMDSFDPKTALASRNVNFYPNPVKQGKNGSLEVPESMIGSTLKLYELNGKEIAQVQVNTTKVSVPLSDLNQGTYIINIFNGNKRFYTEKVVVVR